MDKMGIEKAKIHRDNELGTGSTFQKKCPSRSRREKLEAVTHLDSAQLLPGILSRSSPAVIQEEHIGLLPAKTASLQT